MFCSVKDYLKRTIRQVPGEKEMLAKGTSDIIQNIERTLKIHQKYPWFLNWLTVEAKQYVLYFYYSSVNMVTIVLVYTFHVLRYCTPPPLLNYPWPTIAICMSPLVCTLFPPTLNSYCFGAYSYLTSPCTKVPKFISYPHSLSVDPLLHNLTFFIPGFPTYGSRVTCHPPRTFSKPKGCFCHIYLSCLVTDSSQAHNVHVWDVHLTLQISSFSLSPDPSSQTRAGVLKLQTPKAGP